MNVFNTIFNPNKWFFEVEPYKFKEMPWFAFNCL